MPRMLAYGWTAPNTALGLALVALACATGGRAHVEQGVIEAYGGMLPAVLRCLLVPHGAAAITLGHAVLACDAHSLARLREHEHVHVRQYEQWGPFFLPAYCAASLVALACGGHPYRDNVFEIAARAADQRLEVERDASETTR